MRRAVLTAVILLCGFLSVPFPLSAQFCWKPTPECKTFPITEIGISYLLTSPPETNIRYFTGDTLLRQEIQVFRKQGLYITSNLGLMKKISDSFGVGVLHTLGLGREWELRSALRIRMRKWLGTSSSIDLSPGLILWDTSGNFKMPGFAAELDFKIEEWFALTFGVEYVRGLTEKRIYMEPREFDNPEGPWREVKEIQKHQNDLAFYLGAKSGSYPGLAGNIAAAVAGLVMLMAFMFGND